MGKGDWAALLMLTGIGVALYKLAHPKCRYCDVALAAVGVACPRCGRVATAMQVLLA